MHSNSELIHKKTTYTQIQRRILRNSKAFIEVASTGSSQWGLVPDLDKKNVIQI